MEKQTAIQIFLSKHKISQYSIAKLIGASKSTISAAEKKSVDNLSVRVLRGIALAAKMSPGETLTELLTIEGVELMKNYIKNFQNDLNIIIDRIPSYPNPSLDELMFPEYAVKYAAIFGDIHSAAARHLPTYFESWQVEKDKLVISGDNITVEIALDDAGAPTKEILSVLVKGDPDNFIREYEASELALLNGIETFD